MQKPVRGSVIVGQTAGGRDIMGCPGTKLSHLCGRFISCNQQVWGGGAVMMPYWCDPSNSRSLTDEEINKHCSVWEKGRSLAELLKGRSLVKLPFDD